MRVMIHEAKKALFIAYMFMLPPCVHTITYIYTDLIPRTFPHSAFQCFQYAKEWVKVWYFISQECDISVPRQRERRHAIQELVTTYISQSMILFQIQYKGVSTVVKGAKLILYSMVMYPSVTLHLCRMT